jgi:hypothetical protein
MVRIPGFVKGWPPTWAQQCNGCMEARTTVTYPDLGVAVIAIADDEWRVSDTRVPRSAPALLGFVKQCGSEFEVTQIGAPGRRAHCDRFRDALQRLALGHA